MMHSLRRSHVLIIGLAAVLVIIALVGACQPAVGNIRSNAAVPLPAATMAAYPTPAPTMAARLPDTGGGAGAPADFQAEAPPAQPQERIVIRNANLTLVVDEPQAHLDLITELASEYGGWVVSSQAAQSVVNGQTRVTSASITIRVEAARLDEALARMKQGAGRVENESITGEDVTQSYVDTSSRLANLEAAEAQLQEIMASADDVADVLAVYSELVRIRGEIEVLRGQLQYWDQASAFSLISVTMRATPIPTSVDPVTAAGWQPERTARNALQALINVMRGVADLAIGAVIFGLPLLVFVGLPALFVYRALRRRRTASPARQN